MNIDNVREFHRKQEEAFRLAAQAMELLGDPSFQSDHLHKNADFHLACYGAIVAHIAKANDTIQFLARAK